jgi:quercetin dioxygenase-like cupin family protein
MLHIGMKPGAVIPAHLHKGMAEALYVVEGDFTQAVPGWHFTAFQGRQGTRPAHH